MDMARILIIKTPQKYKKTTHSARISALFCVYFLRLFLIAAAGFGEVWVGWWDGGMVAWWDGSWWLEWDGSWWLEWDGREQKVGGRECEG